MKTTQVEEVIRLSQKAVSLRVVVALLALALMVSGCGGSQPTSSESNASAQPASTMTLAMWSEPDNLNPWEYPTTYDQYIEGMVFNGLVKAAGDLSLQPDLAKDWEWSEDGKTITFHLRDDVKWHDGQPFTADDVAFTFNAVASPKYDGGSTSFVAPIAGFEDVQSGKADKLSGITVVSPTEIRITLSKPNAAFLSGMTQPILPEHILKSVPVDQWKTADFARHPVGTGPYKLVEWKPGQYIKLEANPDYFGGKPKTQTVVWRFGDQNTMMAAFLNHEVDVAPVPIDSADVVKSSGDRLVTVKTFNFQYMGMNLADPRLADPEVRKAFAYAINKTAIVNSLLHGYGEPLDQLFPKGHWSYDPSFKGYDYNVEKAKQILEADGWKLNSQGVREKDGKTLSFTLIYPTGNLVREQSAPLIQQDLAAIGVKVQLQSMDFSTLVTHLLPKDASGKGHAPTPDDYTLMLLGFGITNDPDEYMPYFQSKQTPPVGYNYTNYGDPLIDHLFEQEEAATDQDQRVQLFHRINDKLSAEVPWIPLYMQADLWAVSRKVHNFNPISTTPVTDCVNWWVEK